MLSAIVPANRTRVLRHHADLAAQGIEAQGPHVAAVDEHASVLRIVEARDEVHQRRLARTGRSDDGDHLTRLHVERDAGQRVGAAGIFEMHALEPDRAGCTPEGLGLRRLLHHRLGVENVEGHPQADQVVLERADHVADGLQRFVDGGDIRQHDQQLAGGDAALDGVVRPDAQHQGRPDRRRGGHGQREQRLADGDVHTGVDRVTGLAAEPIQLVVLALKRRDDRQHGHRVVDDRQTVGLHALDLHQPLLDMRRVVADRPVQERHHGNRQQGQGAVDPEGDPDHADQGQAGLRKRLEGQDERARSRRFEVDRVHQSRSADLVAIRDGEPFGVAEEVGAKVGDDALLELGVDVAVHHVEPAADERDEQAGNDGQRQEQEPV